jgi:flagellar biosynthesis protein FlhB
VAENSGQERTEKGTGKRRSEARKRGQVANSREIPATLILLAALGCSILREPRCSSSAQRS